MTSVKTETISGKLEKVVDFRVGEGASEKHEIIPRSGMTPATDGTDIFLPEFEGKFESERDNELALSDFTAHEADHIVEYEDYFGTEINSFREGNSNVVQKYHQRNYAELEENPALAGWIDNIVKDFRIDSQRKNQLPGVNRFWNETLLLAARYMRPSIKRMSQLDSFREQFLQKTLLEETVDEVPEDKRKLLEEVVKLSQSSSSIYQDSRVVKKIYQKFKNNFDITQPIKRLPPRHNTGDNSRTQGSPQQGYQGQCQPREGRDPNEKKPKKLSKEENKKKIGDPKDNEKDKSGGNKDSGDGGYIDKEKAREDFYDKIGEENGIRVRVLKPDITKKVLETEERFENKYVGETESMKRIFRQLQARFYGEKRDFEGQELDYEEFMQGELESRITGIRRDRRVFRKEVENRQRAVWGIHADTSGSTSGKIIEGIKAAFYIFGNGLSTSEHQYGLYSSSDDLYVLKSPDEKWNENVNRKITSLKSGGGGIYLDATSQVIAADLKRVGGNPKGLIIISDFEVCGDEKREKAIVRELYDAKIHPFLIAIGEEHEENAKRLTEDIGSDHYSVIPLDKLHELPNEMFRLFKTYGIAK